VDVLLIETNHSSLLALACRCLALMYKTTFVILVLSVMLLALLYSLLVAVGCPCRCLRRLPSLSSHFSSHHNRLPCGAGTTLLPSPRGYGLPTKLDKRRARLPRIQGRARPQVPPTPTQKKLSVCIQRPTDTTLRLRVGCPCLSYQKEKRVCKAPGATLAPPSFQPHPPFSPHGAYFN
jgi:hypothetical protein